MSSSQTNSSNQPLYPKVLRQLLVPGETELVAIRSDFSTDGDFQSRWIIVTNWRVVILSSSGDEVAEEIPLPHIVSVRAKSFVGGGQLEIARERAPLIRLPYTASESQQFIRISQAIERAKAGGRIETKPPPRIRCEQCGRLLPSRGATCRSCLPKLDTFRRIARYLIPYRKQVGILALVAIVISAAAVVPPLITAWIVDGVLLRAGDFEAVSRQVLLACLVIALLLVHLAGWGAQWIQGHTAATVGAKVTADIRNQIFYRLEMLSLPFFSKWDVGSLIARVSRDAEALQDFLVRRLPSAVVNIAAFLGILGFMFWLHWQLALIIMLTVPGALLWGLLFWQRMSKLYHRWWQVGSRFSSHINETLAGARVTKMFRQEAEEAKRFGRENERLFQAHVLTGQRRAAILAGMGLVTAAGVVILWFYGGLLVQQSKLTPGELVAFYGYVILFYGPLLWFGHESDSMTKAFTAAQRIFEILDTPPAAVERSGTRPLPTIAGRVTFQNVHFAYEQAHPVLKGIDLDVLPGEFIGIVGPSGVGKTTLMHLLCRFYDTDKGMICVDGLDIREARLVDFRKKIGVVLQEPFLFSGTIAENICYGTPGTDFRQIVAAARSAFAHEFIMQKIDGYDTRIGEAGRGLSQGEKQRVALARCLLCDPRIIILDEATSSIDPISEQCIQRAINQLRGSRTTFAIAHRLSTLRNADRIIVLEHGRICEEGTYSELVKRGGAFSLLVRLQYRIPETVSIED